jgi:hypothetical protein
MAEIRVDPNKPSVFMVEELGWIDYWEFEETIWMADIYALSKGKGVRLGRLFIEYARSVNKDIYGEINPQEFSHGMTTDRIKQWYHLWGARPISMIDHPNAMVLEVRDGMEGKRNRRI